jgi:hypothetical protein
MNENTKNETNEPTVFTLTPEQHIDSLRAIKGQMLWAAAEKKELLKGLSKVQANVLEAIREQTLFRSGPRKGQAKQAIKCDQFYEHTVLSLEKKGLIRFVDNALGFGYVASTIE